MGEQFSMWDYLREPIRIDKPIRLITLFSGYDSQAIALKRLGVNFEHYRAVEIDKYAIKSLNLIHDKDFEPLDIREIKGGQLGIVDKEHYTYIMTYSYPCFVGNTLVLTKDGLKEIKNVCVGDYVLSHDNEYHKVINSLCTGVKETVKINGMGIDEIICTPNHKFYTRVFHRFNTHKNGKAYVGRDFDEPQWEEASNLTKNHYLGIAINQNSIIPKWDGIDFEWKDGRKTRHKNELSKYMDNYDFWWLIGAYVGDGWIRSQGGIIICGNDNKIRDIKERTDRLGIKCYKSKEKTVYKMHFSCKELEKFVLPFGRGAANKHIPGYVFDLPKELLKGFLEGYLNADGHFVRNGYLASSVSRELIYGIGQIVAKVYNRPYSISKLKERSISVIEGRTVHNKQQWSVRWKIDNNKQDKAFFEDGYVWYPIRKIEKCSIEQVYDITVEDSHSFMANGTIAHNCTSLSVAGRQEGMERDSGTASSLIWEVERLLKECNELGAIPDILQMENVTECHNYKNLKEFNEWTSFLESLGYTNYLADLNASDYLIPQHRERSIMFSILGNYNYKFPEPVELEKCMADYLEDEVPENLYIKSEKALNLIINLVDKGVLENEDALNERTNERTNERLCIDGTIKEPRRIDVANCIKAKDRGLCNHRSEENCIIE